jgi:hypothetical protein
MSDPEEEKPPTTQIIKPDSAQRSDDMGTLDVPKSRIYSRQPSSAAEPQTATPVTKHQMSLYIRGIQENLTIRDGESVLLGRSDEAVGSDYFVDLTPYGGLERGVSRTHLRLNVQGDKLYVTDLGSANGTYLDGKRLNPNEAYPLYAGANLVLGRLAVKVVFS